MDAAPLPPSSAVRSLRSLRHHHTPSTSRAAFPPPPPPSPFHHDPRPPPSRFEYLQQQQPHVPTPNLTLRRIMEQRNLLPSQEVLAFQATSGEVNDCASHSPPSSSLRFVGMERVNRTRFPDQRWHLPANSYNTTTSSTRVYTSSRHRQQESRLPPQRYRQAPQAATPATPQASPVASLSQDGSAHSSTTRGLGHSRRRVMTPEERRRARTCVIDGCNNYIVDNHRCFRHGGGKRCSIDGCNSSAKQLGLCWRHGGSVLCKVEGCSRGVKVKGLCWGHGGGKKKKQMDQSTPSTPSNSSGPHCIFDGCQSAAVLHSFCGKHSQEVVRPGYVFEL